MKKLAFAALALSLIAATAATYVDCPPIQLEQSLAQLKTACPSVVDTGTQTDPPVVAGIYICEPESLVVFVRESNQQVMGMIRSPEIVAEWKAEQGR